MELKDFAGTGVLERFKKVFQHKDKHVASDGRWIAWKTDSTPITDPEAKGPPQLEDSWFIDFNPTENLPEYKQDHCTDCSGTGVVQEDVECEECNGTGYLECGECGADKECDECDGSTGSKIKGEVCPECNGDKYIDGVEQFNGENFAISRLVKLREAGAKVCFVEVPAHKSQWKLLGFKFGDITGYLLGVTK